MELQIEIQKLVKETDIFENYARSKIKLLKEYQKSIISSAVTGKVKNIRKYYMSKLNPTEKKFEKHIEKYLNLIKFKSINHQKYNRKIMSNRRRVVRFYKKNSKRKME